MEDKPVIAFGIFRNPAYRINQVNDIDTVTIGVQADRQIVMENILTGGDTDKAESNTQEDGNGPE